MARSDSADFWPYGKEDQNLLAIELLTKHVRMDTDKRTLPAQLPGPTVDANGMPLPEGDPGRAPQRFASFVPISIDGAVAAELIKFNTVNRKLSKNNIRALTQAILNGEWCFNGVSSTLPCSNTALQDKQHTLQSIINAFAIGAATGKPVKPILMIPIIGLHPTVFDTFDSGKQRSTNDTLFVGARINAVDLLNVHEVVWSHSLRLIAQYLNLVNDLDPTNPFYLENIRDRIPNDRVIELFNQSPALQESIKYCSRLGIPHSGALLPLAVIGTAHAIIAEVQSTTAANTFAKGLATGANLEEASPIRQLREQVMRDKNRPGGHRMEGIEMLAMCMRTWNCIATHTAHKKRIRSFDLDGSFPVPVPTQRPRAPVTR